MNKQWSDWHKGFNDELFPAPFNLAGEPLRSEIDAEGEARVRALAEAEARKAQSEMICKCGSVLSAVTFTCVQGKYCPIKV
jgi:hypothetical protein